MNLFAKKPIDKIIAEANDSGQYALKRHLTGGNLILLGIGATIGAGIFLYTARAAAMFAGPGVILSYVIAGIGCALAGLCYAELASMIPVSGSAYTYSYGTMGQIVAWIIGWDLIIEYALGAATVSIGWTRYFNEFVGKFISPEMVLSPKWSRSCFEPVDPGIVNLPALVIIGLLSVLLIRGIRESALVNALIVFVKVAIVLLFITIGWSYIHPEYHRQIIPDPSTIEVKTPFGSTEQFFGGWKGILRGAGIVFFAFLGFDAVSTAAGETINPKKNLPIGILGSLLGCTILYILFSYVLTGIAPVEALRQMVPGTNIVAGPISPVLPLIIRQYMEQGWLADLVTMAVLFGFSSVILVNLLAQSRIFISMSRDGMIPRVFSDIHPKYRTPWKSNIILFLFTGLFAAFAPEDMLGEMTSIGTLFAFILICAGTLILRKTHPEMDRPFKTPLLPLVAGGGILFCGAMMYELGPGNWQRLIVWLLIGMAVYFGYSRRNAV